ncbi:MAG: hypothetical protein ABI822_00545, partial [Bryobacteraceae bacterium]
MDRMEPEIAEQFQVITQPTRLSLAFTTLANTENSLQLLLRYETTYSRAFDRALKALEKLQRSRPESTPAPELRNEPNPVIPAPKNGAKNSTENEAQNAAENPVAKDAGNGAKETIPTPLPRETDEKTPHPGPASTP